MPRQDLEHLPDKVPAKELHRVLIPFFPERDALKALQNISQNEDHSDEETEESEEDTDTSDGLQAQHELIRELQEELDDLVSQVEPVQVNLGEPDFEPIEHDHVEEFIETNDFKKSMNRLPTQPTIADLEDELDIDPSDPPDWLEDGEVQIEDLPDELLIDYQIVRFPISHLVAMQRNVQTPEEAYEDLPTDEDEFDELMEYCLPAEGGRLTTGELLTTQGNEFLGYQVTSRDPNIGYNFESGASSSGHTVKVQVVGSPNFVQVKQFNGRFVLKNGYHRVVKLLEEGHTHVPAVLSEAGDWSDVTEDEGHFGPDTVLDARPPLVIDFVSDWIPTITQPAKNTVIRVMVEKTKIPR